MPAKLSLHATKRSFFDKLKETRVPIHTIIDVGVNYGTPELKYAFPDIHHLLFEPSSQFYEHISREYSGTPHTLFPCALSNSNGSLHLIESSLDKNGVVTHTQISTQPPKAVDGFDIVSSTPIDVHRLDSLLADRNECPYLLKIDIDGQDVQVIEGAEGIMSDISVIVVEAQVDKLAETINAALKHGFVLVDIIDRCYYGMGLWQADLAFINKLYINDKWSLKPWKSWNPDLWKEAN